MVSWMLVEQISFYPGSKTMRFLIAIIVSAFYTSFPASVYARCCEESDDTRETPWIALQERNPDFGESDCSLVGSCSGERYCLSAKEAKLLFFAPEGKNICLLRLF